MSVFGTPDETLALVFDILQDECLKELEGTSPANEAEGQHTTSASRTKLLENGRDSETFTVRKSSTDVDVDDVDLEISSGLVSKNIWRTKKSKLEQHNTNSADEIFLVKETIMVV